MRLLLACLFVTLLSACTTGKFYSESEKEEARVTVHGVVFDRSRPLENDREIYIKKVNGRPVSRRHVSIELSPGRHYLDVVCTLYLGASPVYTGEDTLVLDAEPGSSYQLEAGVALGGRCESWASAMADQK